MKKPPEKSGGFFYAVFLFSVIPALSRNPAEPRLRRERVFCDQGLDRTGSRIKCGMTEGGGAFSP
jgi:hypothetical protein